MQIITFALPVAEQAQQNEYTGKFIQVLRQGDELLIFAPFSLCTYHMDIFQQFLDRENIPYKRPSEMRLDVSSDEAQVKGGGRFRWQPAQNTLRLWDSSQAYGHFERDGLKQKIAAAQHPWNRLKVAVE